LHWLAAAHQPAEGWVAQEVAACATHSV